MKVVQGLAIGNLKAYGNPQLIIYRRQRKCLVQKPNLMSCYANGMRSSKALMSNVCPCNRMLIQMHSPHQQLPWFFYPTHQGKIWIFTNDLYCHDLQSEDVSPLFTVKLWKHRQSGHSK